MVLSNTLIRISLISAISLFLFGCASSPQTQAPISKLTLPEPLILSSEGSIGNLYRSWILPFNTIEDRYIPHNNSDLRSSSEAAIRSGFSRFCLANSGKFNHESGRYGDTYTCSTFNKELIGEFTTQRVKGNLLNVNFDSPDRVKHRKAALNDLQERKAQNGPTGTIQTDEGSFQFLRIGNFRDRDLLEIRINSEPTEYVSIENIHKIDFSPQCCDITVKTKDGRTREINKINLIKRSSPNMTMTYGGGRGGLPIVIIDPDTQQPYTRIFPNLEGIRSITLNPASAWELKRIDTITSSLNVFSSSRLHSYSANLRVKANQLYSEATRKGWIKLLSGGNLTPQLKEHLEYELRSITRNPDCKGDIITGITSLAAPLRCRAAKRELRLVIDSGYSLVTDVTPLSAIIVLNKIEEDLN